MHQDRELRRNFLKALGTEIRVIWPILSGLVGVQWMLGLTIGYLEGWRVSDSTYFTFVTGLTIGYGDLVPARISTRLIAVAIGFIGIVLSGLVAAVAVRALQEATKGPDN
jgi:hypothetical protein